MKKTGLFLATLVPWSLSAQAETVKLQAISTVEICDRANDAAPLTCARHPYPVESIEIELQNRSAAPDPRTGPWGGSWRKKVAVDGFEFVTMVEVRRRRPSSEGTAAYDLTVSLGDSSHAGGLAGTQLTLSAPTPRAINPFEVVGDRFNHAGKWYGLRFQLLAVELGSPSGDGAW